MGPESNRGLFAVVSFWTVGLEALPDELDVPVPGPSPLGLAILHVPAIAPAVLVDSWTRCYMIDGIW